MRRTDQEKKAALWKREQEIIDTLGSENNPKKQIALAREWMHIIDFGRYSFPGVLSRPLFCERGRG